MEFGKGYKVDDNYFVEVKPGEYDCKIVKLILKKTKTGNPMVEIKLALMSGGLVTYYLVDDRSNAEKAQYSNQRITKFFDCFKIKRGNFNIAQWRGAKGRVKLDYGKPNEEGKVYIEVKNLLLAENKSMQNSGTHNNNIQNRNTQGQRMQNKSMQNSGTHNNNIQNRNTQGQRMQNKSMQNIPSQKDVSINKQRKPQTKVVQEDDFDNFPEDLEADYYEDSYFESDDYNADSYEPTNEEIMEEARREGYDVSDEYIHNEPNTEIEEEAVAYEEPEIY